VYQLGIFLGELLMDPPRRARTCLLGGGALDLLTATKIIHRTLLKHRAPSQAIHSSDSALNIG
jgi:hypothetical protein